MGSHRRPAVPAHVTARRPLVERVACWGARRRKTAVAIWLALVAAAFLAGHFGGGGDVQQYDAGQAGHGERVLASLGVVAPPSESVLVEARPAWAGGHPATGTAARAATAAQVRQAARQVEAALRALPQAAAGVRGPAGTPGLAARGGQAALVTFTIPGPQSAADATVTADLAAVGRVQARFPGLVVAEAGHASVDRVANAVLGQDLSRSEFTALPLTLVLLLAVFGALIAAGIPVLLAGTAVVAAVGLLDVAGHWLPVGSGSSELVLVIGMAVGVDYSLFYLRREREERMNGHDGEALVRIAASTSGRAILVSGLTVMVSLAGLFLTGLDMFTGIGFGTIMVVGVAVLGSLFFLPALLSWLGPWADRLQLPYLGRRLTHPRPSALWAGLARRVARRPLLLGGAAAGVLLALAVPALGMRLADPPVDLPSSQPVVHVLADISRDFPAGPQPAQVVVTGASLSSPATVHALTALRDAARSGGAIHGPVGVTAVAHGKALVVEVPLAGPGSGPVTGAALTTLQDKVLPATIGQVPGAAYSVTGQVAADYDLHSTLHVRTPLVFGVVALLAFVLLMLAFRSLTIPLVSVALNFLSVGAAYGLMTFVFQDGHFQQVLGFTSFGALIPWVPLFTFTMLFGLSMDYHVFIVSRIREQHLGGASPAEAIARGIGRSAGVVSSAAVIMVAVFSIFATLDLIDVKMLGVGLAGAILLDATLVRGIVLPAALAVLGRRAWYLPRWLEWLPGRNLASDAAAPAAAPGDGPAGQAQPATLEPVR